MGLKNNVYFFFPPLMDSSAYTLPELLGKTLVLDYATIAGIYLNEITVWNDDRIKALNDPEIADLLPAKPIIVITQTIESEVTLMFTSLLNATVPAFASQVHHNTMLILDYYSLFSLRFSVKDRSERSGKLSCADKR